MLNLPETTEVLGEYRAQGLWGETIEICSPWTEMRIICGPVVVFGYMVSRLRMTMNLSDSSEGCLIKSCTFLCKKSFLSLVC